MASATKYADDPATENAKKALEAEKKVSDVSKAEYAKRMKGKPTPTQEENDLAMLGAHILTHEDDGSEPDPHGQTTPGDNGGKSPQPYAGTRHEATKPAHGRHSSE
jgi:hypothetical protein